MKPIKALQSELDSINSQRVKYGAKMGAYQSKADKNKARRLRKIIGNLNGTRLCNSAIIPPLPPGFKSEFRTEKRTLRKEGWRNTGVIEKGQVRFIKFDGFDYDVQKVTLLRPYRDEKGVLHVP